MTRKKRSLALTPARLGWASLGLAVVGWAGLTLYTYAFPPAEATLPAFFAILFVAVTATVIPPLLWLNARLSKPLSFSLWRPLRQGVEIGLWATLCVWLQWVRLLNLLTAALFFVVLILIEWFIISRK